ncbi:hypothetical protein B0A48_00918 [Cryoendolithus antarcticus]|uniref:Methyltransferase domain-containing protein n=1 Tax=Cryoendolithus antarcticus TaxID=1507870 RepID=A0A1V8TS51_9PEZI|nr:hypothetical protein B0A48_00918 [Cryoendolithus antarcticus]
MGTLAPDPPLPYFPLFASPEAYVDSLLNHFASTPLLQTLCGGVHLLDFFTSTPDLYATLLPPTWRDFLAELDIMDLLDLLMREDLDALQTGVGWRGTSTLLPADLIEYVRGVRQHTLDRQPRRTNQCQRNRKSAKLTRRVAVGMNVKKRHEVSLFSAYVDELDTTLSESSVTPNASSTGPIDSKASRDQMPAIGHLIDFGSGQNYLGRALASEPFNRHVIAIERKGHNQDRAVKFDVMAQLREKEVVMRNKKTFRGDVDSVKPPTEQAALPTPPPEPNDEAAEVVAASVSTLAIEDDAGMKVELSADGKGSVQYISHEIQDGNLGDVIAQIVLLPDTNTHNAAKGPPTSQSSDNTFQMTISLHSCGNLLHHALRSLTLNPSIRAIALVGCCYNLLTERLSPATYKLPSLRSAAHPRLTTTSTQADPHGFPMSEKFCKADVRLNITARMMAVQAPWNWGRKDSEGFFTRHFYRALLQRVFLDAGVVGQPQGGEASPRGHTSGTPIIIGSLPKSAYLSFATYARAALTKLREDPERGEAFAGLANILTDEKLEAYERDFAAKKKELSVVWSLMAFSAGVVEALIVVDRWCWLREQSEVAQSWVECVFDPAISPRNFVVVGIKK